jgi:hypothetical protein
MPWANPKLSPDLLTRWFIIGHESLVLTTREILGRFGNYSSTVTGLITQPKRPILMDIQKP